MVLYKLDSLYMYNMVYSIVDVENSNYHMTFIIHHNIVGKVSGNWQFGNKIAIATALVDLNLVVWYGIAAYTHVHMVYTIMV